MKSRVKVLIIAAVVLIALPLLGWTGTFLYWHFKITRALRILDVPQPAVQRENELRELSAAERPIEAAGCRSYPYLVRALPGARNPGRLISLLAWTFNSTTPHQGQEMDPPTRFATDFLWGISSHTDRSPQKLQEDVRRICEWWDASGHEFHHWWRVWESNCHPRVPESNP